MSSRATDLNPFSAETVDEGSDGTGSLGSLSARSRNPGPDETIRCSDLLNLPSAACRVIMSQKGTRRVCARPRMQCSRKLHTAMPKERRAAPGFCVAYQSSNGDVDGLHDRPWTKEGARLLREAEMEESTRRLAELGPGIEEAKEEVEVNLGLVET